MGRASKPFKSHEQLLETLIRRGMQVDAPEAALETLKSINYYRLSGYWYPFRVLDSGPNGRGNQFYPDTTFDHVLSLYYFDSRLREAVFATITEVEVLLRAVIGHTLGVRSPNAHLEPAFLDPHADELQFRNWTASFKNELGRSREDFVAHHLAEYAGKVPVWVATEVLSWGNLMNLYQMARLDDRKCIASTFGPITVSQLSSWLKTLNIVRNYCAHHGRLWNRVYALQPKLPAPNVVPQFDGVHPAKNRLFGQLSVLLYMTNSVNSPRQTGRISQAVSTFPAGPTIDFSHMGLPAMWQDHPLWQAT